jgi:hypothetical protein
LSAALEAEGSLCFLTVAKRGQQDDAPIWEFERVMMRSRLFLVDLSTDCDCLTNCQFSSSGRGQSYLLGKGKLCSRKKADGRRRIFGCGERPDGAKRLGQDRDHGNCIYPTR